MVRRVRPLFRAANVWWRCAQYIVIASYIYDACLTVHFDMYSESCMDIKTAISNSKSVILQKKISDCNGDQNFFLLNC